MSKRPLAPQPGKQKRAVAQHLGPGQPSLSQTEPSVRFNVVVPVSLHEYASLIADDNVSAGCRAALEYHRDNAAAVATLLVAFDTWRGKGRRVYYIDDPNWDTLLAARKAVKL